MKAVQQRGWNGVVAHFRSCGGIANTAPVFYHLGDTPEIAFMLNTLARRYSTIYAVGVSLGAMPWPNIWASRAAMPFRMLLPSFPRRLMPWPPVRVLTKA